MKKARTTCAHRDRLWLGLEPPAITQSAQLIFRHNYVKLSESPMFLAKCGHDATIVLD